jgi:probable F420-dependent oxidoreductase
VRFHQSLTFLPADQIVPLSVACDQLGYAGMYLSDHLFHPRQLRSTYTYSDRADGAPGWDPATSWPDPMCVFSGLSTVTTSLTFTTGVYVAPARDLITVAKSVATAAVLSADRVRFGVGVGWCREEFEQTGQQFATRGRRLDEMIVALRSLWGGGWVEHRGTYYDVPPCQMNPSPRRPVPILAGGHSPAALRRAATLCDGWIAAGAYREDEAWHRLGALEDQRAAAGRGDEPFAVYLSLAERPDVELYRRFEDAGVTDMICAPWMSVTADGAADGGLGARLSACERFAERVVAPLAR